MEAKRLFEDGERNASKLLEASRKVIEREPLVNLQYLELCDPETLEPLSGNIERALLAIAAWVGKTRLIDNIILE
jgi:pantothenate synthetase